MHICHYVNVYISLSILIFENFRGGGRTPGTPFLESAPGTHNVIFYKINDRIGLTHVTIEYTHGRTRFTHDTIGLIFVRIE